MYLSLTPATSHRQEIARQKIELASEIPDEPPLDRPDCVRISIKLPDGSRIERRFSTSHSLKVGDGCLGAIWVGVGLL